MATTTLAYADMILRYPEFTTGDATEQTRIGLFISDAAYDMNATHWDDGFDRACLTLAAHHLTVAGRAAETGGGGAGAVTSRTRGEHQVSFSVPTKSDAYEDFRTTPYGMIYLRLLQNLGLTPIVSGE